VTGIVWVRLISSSVCFRLMNMCNCFGAYPQYYNNYSPYQGYGGMYPQYYSQSYPQYYNNYSPYQGYGGMYPQYYSQSYPQCYNNYSPYDGYGGMYTQYCNNYPMYQYSGIACGFPTSGCSCGHSMSPGYPRGDYRVGNCLIICSR